MHSDIGEIIQAKGYGNFYAKTSKGGFEETYRNNKNTMYAYIQPTSDIEIARGQYWVSIPELNGSLFLARLLVDPAKIGPNGTGQVMPRLQNHQQVVVVALNDTGDYGIAFTNSPITQNRESEINNYLTLSESSVQLSNNLPPNDSSFAVPLNLHTLQQGLFTNEAKISNLTINPADINKSTYVWPTAGNIDIHGYNGEKYEQILNTLTTSKANEYALYDGVNLLKSEKSKAELFSFYHLTKYRIANSTKRLFEYKNGKIIPGPLLSRIKKINGQFSGAGNEIISYIDRITHYLNIADGIIETTADFIEWLDSSMLTKVTDLISVVGLPTSLKIGNVINLGASYSNGPIKVGVDLNLGNRYVEAFLEGVANSLISDLIGETSLSDLVKEGLGQLGIDVEGKDDPKKTQSINTNNPEIPTRRGNKSLVEIIDSLGGLVPGSFGDYIKKFRTITSSVGLVNNGTIQLDNPQAEYFAYLDYGNLNLDLQTPEGQMAAYLSCYGAEYAPFTIKQVANLINTNNPVYLLLAVLPYLDLANKIQVILFAYYVLDSVQSKNYLVQEFIAPELHSQDTIYIKKLLSLQYDEIFYFLEELELEHFNFNNLLMNPLDELAKIDINSSLMYYIQELLAGKILNFYRGCILLSSGFDITLDLDLYSKLSTLTKQVHYLYE